MSACMFKLSHKFTIDSARSLPTLPEGHPCRKIHGHRFEIDIHVVGPLNEIGWVMDFYDLQIKANKVIKPLDHCLLNEHIPNPTTENLCKFIYDHLKKDLPELCFVCVKESADTECIYPYKV